MKNHVFKRKEYVVGDVRNYLETVIGHGNSVASLEFENIGTINNEELEEEEYEYVRSDRINASVNTKEDYWDN